MALCAALQARAKDLELTYIGSGNDVERQLVEATDLPYRSLPTGKFRRYNRGVVRELVDIKTQWANTKDAYIFLTARRRAYALLKELKPDAVFGKGGYTALPIGIAATKLGIPFVIHESDIVMGLTNRWLAPAAQVIATGFPVKSFEGMKLQAQFVHTGNPVRAEVLSGSRLTSRAHLGLHDRKPVIAIIGGSQGAEGINKAIWASLQSLTASAHIWHQTGEHGINEAEQQRQNLPAALCKRYHPQTFFHAELADIYAVADVVIARSSANVLTELGLLKKAAIFIPNPGSTANHTMANARFVEARGGARVLDETTLTPRLLQQTVHQLLDHPQDRLKLGQHLHSCVRAHAAEHLAEVMLEVAGAGRL